MILVLALGLFAARRAEACGSGYDGNPGALFAGVAIVGGGYAAGTLTFAIADVAHEHSVGYGIAEAAVNAPLAVGFAAALVKATQDPQAPHGEIFATLFIVHAALAVHGIYTIYKWDDAHPGAVITPAPISDGAGIGLAGTF